MQIFDWLTWLQNKQTPPLDTLHQLIDDIGLLISIMINGFFFRHFLNEIVYYTVEFVIVFRNDCHLENSNFTVWNGYWVTHTQRVLALRETTPQPHQQKPKCAVYYDLVLCDFSCWIFPHRENNFGNRNSIDPRDDDKIGYIMLGTQSFVIALPENRTQFINSHSREPWL